MYHIKDEFISEKNVGASEEDCRSFNFCVATEQCGWCQSDGLVFASFSIAALPVAHCRSRGTLQRGKDQRWRRVQHETAATQWPQTERGGKG